MLDQEAGLYEFRHCCHNASAVGHHGTLVAPATARNGLAEPALRIPLLDNVAVFATLTRTYISSGNIRRVNPEATCLHFTRDGVTHLVKDGQLVHDVVGVHCPWGRKEHRHVAAGVGGKSTGVHLQAEELTTNFEEVAAESRTAAHGARQREPGMEGRRLAEQVIRTIDPVCLDKWLSPASVVHPRRGPQPSHPLMVYWWLPETTSTWR